MSRCIPGTCYCSCQYNQWNRHKCRAKDHCGRHNKGCHVNCKKPVDR